VTIAHPETQSVGGWVQTVTVARPSLENNTADAQRLIAALEEVLQAKSIRPDLCLLRTLPDDLRTWGYNLRCLLFEDAGIWHLIDVKGQQGSDLMTGLAVDLGTTTVVLRLVNLLDGAVLGERSFDNPQIQVAPDILARIHATDAEGGLENLNHLIIAAINQEAATLAYTLGLTKEAIGLVCVAGNTTMTHLFMGLCPRWIIREPYIPVTNRPGLVRADDLGIAINPAGRVFILPNVGSYFGGDLIAGILHSELDLREETAILVDVGTNAEVVLGNRDWLMACAGAAGPALEGGVTRMGMMAASGAIDRIRILGQKRSFEIHTIDNAPPIGICGSGVIDLAAQLYLSGMIDIRGKLLPDRCQSRLETIDGMHHLVIVPREESGTGEALRVSQADLDSLVRSKAAMYTILETITGQVGMDQRQLKRFFVAGTFGSYIDPVSAIAIGMLPDLPLDCYRPLGNSSLEGATRALLDVDAVRRIDAIRNAVTYMELNVNQEFMNRFSAAKFLPHTDTSRFPSVKRWE
jgi:uncharacterized 2Fe-2S/4Fe-4S cluster protein (DUF4445 family)